MLYIRPEKIELGVPEQGAVDQSGYIKHTSFTEVPNDFDSIKSVGFYSLQNPIHMQNRPPQITTGGVIGILIVGGWNAARLIQIYADENGIFRRYINSNGWSEWAAH